MITIQLKDSAAMRRAIAYLESVISEEIDFHEADGDYEDEAAWREVEKAIGEAMYNVEKV